MHTINVCDAYAGSDLGLEAVLQSACHQSISSCQKVGRLPKRFATSTPGGEMVGFVLEPVIRFEHVYQEDLEK